MSAIEEEKKKYKVIIINEMNISDLNMLMSFLWTLRSNSMYSKLDVNKLMEERSQELFEEKIGYKCTIVIKEGDDN